MTAAEIDPRSDSPATSRDVTGTAQESSSRPGLTLQTPKRAAALAGGGWCPGRGRRDLVAAPTFI